MLMVIFEFTVKSGKGQSYFELVESMRRQVENVDGFLGVERFQSCSDKNRFISVSKWRDEGAIREWGGQKEHKKVQEIGKKEILVPENVSTNISGNTFTAKGPLGELSYQIVDGITVSIEDNTISVSRKNDEKTFKELHGLTRSLIFNIIDGVSNGYQKELNLVGVGYTADASNNDYLLLNLGFSHPIYFQRPNSINFETPNNTTIIVKGINKQEVGEVSAKIRNLRKPEPFKGKGIKYSDEYIRRKAGKTVGVGA